jgi:5-hydroxyisourate hydrolase
MAGIMSRISTHILDTTRGKPASGVSVRLEESDAARGWKPIASHRTDADGRAVLIQRDSPLGAGVYRLAFDTAAYFQLQGMESLYPVVHVTFEVRDGESHFHIPLLLSANGYTTYRGS